MPGAGNPQALNRYSYVFNDPIGLSDPTGHGDNCPDLSGYMCRRRLGLRDSSSGNGSANTNPWAGVLSSATYGCSAITLACLTGSAIGESSSGYGLAVAGGGVKTDNGNGVNEPVCVYYGSRPVCTDPNNVFNQRVNSGPDYTVLTVGIPLWIIPVVGPFVSVELQGTKDYYGNWYFGLGGGVGPSYPIPANLSAAWFLRPDRPNETEMEQLISSHSAYGSLGFVGGGGLTWQNPNKPFTWQDVAAEGGLYTPQIGAGYIYSWQISGAP